jgi:hypothetical protein
MSSLGGPNIVTTTNPTTTVGSVAALQTAINNASSGDVVVLTNGVYINNTLSISKSNITVKAATPGGVFLNGTNAITISGSNVVFSGFQFTSGDIGTGTVIEVTGSSNIVTQLNFSDYYAAKYIRISDGSQYNQITFCNFQKKPAAAQIGCTVQISTSPTVPGYHKIRYCSFQNYYGVGGDNGNEPIRIGLGSERDNVSRTVVEKCYFNNTGLGDGETISIKSGENTVRFCTFTNQQNGTLSFRNGANNVAYSNFFIDAGGIRVKEANNIYCYNNYFYNSGNPVSLVYVSGSIYANVLNNVNFIHNTFVECSNGIDLGGSGATNNTWANNIFKRSSGSIFTNANAGTTWAGNIYSGNLGITISSGVTNADPLLTINSDGYYGLSSTSPAINSASSSYPSILDITNIDDDSTLAFDISGQARPALATSKDVGADEYTTGTTTNRPLGVNDVGPNYLGGPSIMDGLVLHLDAANPKSYPGTGTTWYDRSGSLNAGVVNNGTLVNSPTFDSGNSGSIVFNGTNQTVTLTATPSSLGMIGGNFTISIWIYNNGTTKGGLVSSQSNSVAGGQYEFSINSANNVQVTYYGGGTVNTSIVSNTWYMLTHTYNYATKSSRLYKNGLLVSSVTMTADLITTEPIIIGWYGYGGGYFNGKIPLVQIYGRDISATEVLQNYNATKSRFQ